MLTTLTYHVAFPGVCVHFALRGGSRELHVWLQQYAVDPGPGGESTIILANNT